MLYSKKIKVQIDGEKMKIKLLLLPIVFFLITGCKEEKNLTPTTPNNEKEISSCVGCHTNYTVLKAIADPDTSAPAGGCGGDAPHIEPYDRVFMGGDGFNQFINSVHGKIGCTYCHNGIDSTSDKKIAHSNSFISKPSKYATEKCANCHPTIVNRAKNSLHEQGWGQKKMVTVRSGVNSFSDLSELMQKGYNKHCSTCHATCGDCHVNRPPAGGGGLYNGHAFSKTPNSRDNCVACHSSRGGHAYYGIASGTVPDVHLTSAGYQCTSCHKANEIHGDGNIYDQRYKMPLLPKCQDCHTTIANSNAYHSVHLNTFNCQTCHSQNYNNCGSCHIGGEGARITSHQSFKIALNPIPETKPYKYATVRRSLMAPDSWELYGTPNLPNFNARTTFKYTTPHNIQRWTSRTQVNTGKPCYDNCHIIFEGSTYRNRNLYLFNSDLLQTWEIQANQTIVVDGKLPASWGNP